MRRPMPAPTPSSSRPSGPSARHRRRAPRRAYQTAHHRRRADRSSRCCSGSSSAPRHHARARRRAARSAASISCPRRSMRESLAFLARRSACARIKIPSGDLTNAPLLLRGRAARPTRHPLDRHGDARRGRGGARRARLRLRQTDGAAGARGLRGGLRRAPGGRRARCAARHAAALHDRISGAAAGDVNLRAMDTLRRAFGLPVGLLRPHAGHRRAARRGGARRARDREALHARPHAARARPRRLARAGGARRRWCAAIRAASSSALGDGARCPHAGGAANIAVARKASSRRAPIARGRGLHARRNLAAQAARHRAARRSRSGTSSAAGARAPTAPTSRSSHDAPVIVIGAGGHARVLRRRAARAGAQVLGLRRRARRGRGAASTACRPRRSTRVLDAGAPRASMLANGVGSVGAPTRGAGSRSSGCARAAIVLRDAFVHPRGGGRRRSRGSARARRSWPAPCVQPGARDRRRTPSSTPAPSSTTTAASAIMSTSRRGALLSRRCDGRRRAATSAPAPP